MEQIKEMSRVKKRRAHSSGEEESSYYFLKFKLQIPLSRIGCFWRKKGNLKFSDSKMRWREESENFSLSQYVTLHLKFSENNPEAHVQVEPRYNGHQLAKKTFAVLTRVFYKKTYGCLARRRKKKWP